MPKKKMVAKKFVKKPKVEKLKPRTEARAESGSGNKKAYALLRGMHDVLPKDEKYWKAFYHAAENLAEHFQFGRLETPLLEEAGLFVRSIGKGTDVIDKEMYVFEDRDANKVALRPENTASAVRAYIMHGMWNMAQPVKMWYWGAMFRYDRPQAGRFRQFNQMGFETIGDADPVEDAELILIAHNFYKDLGLPVEVHINSIGMPEERQKYKTALVEYYRSKRSYLCDDCKQRLNKNPLRLLDCKQERCQPIKEEAPQIIAWLEEDSKNHFTKVLEYLDELGVPYVLKPSLVRGLDYYTRTVFEVYTVTAEGENEAHGAQSALGGGGRYDLLVEEMGGKAAPAAGFSIGIERSVSALKQYLDAKQIKFAVPQFDAFMAQLGDQARRRALKTINDLRASGLKISYNFSKNSLKGQLETANSLQVPYALILGQKEVQDGTIIIRDMESGVQEIVDQKKVENILKKKLSRFDLGGK
ncbi:MAG: histidine--tRNA ligase [Candidatus Magasanikbacteria bacterium]|nr:histidine--tRNA ligase [Candidatus Magasanikbacteria bacterium]